MTYTYVIIGAGSAGCVLASRLSEDRDTGVLLLEAGGDDTGRDISIPAAFSRLFKSKYDWAYLTEPQPELNGRQLDIPRGKVLGGSSAINAMIYIRGHRSDYELWRELGNTAWGYADVLPYFIKSENRELMSSAYHGSSGPLNVADPRYVNPLTHAFVAAGMELGLPHNEDFNGPKQEGVGYYQVTQKGGRRHSVASAFLKPVLDRSNLTVVTGAHVTKILIDKGRAIGVKYQVGGNLHEVEVQGEVILAAGAIASPQLLMLSGIGPATHLNTLGIEVLHHLPGVGQNLQDHLAIILTYQCTQPVSLANAERLSSILRYLLFKKGPLTSNVTEAGAFVRSEDGLRAPDLQVGFVPAYAHYRGSGRPSGHFFSIGCTYLRPRSRGCIQLRSVDAGDPPLIQPAFLSDEADLKGLVDGFKLCRLLIEASPFDPYRGEELYPRIEVQSDDEIVEFIRAYSQTVDHPVGTSKMGVDRMAVVDPRLRVRGIEGLRVVDASIMPTVIGGNTNAPVIMIAEKAAEFIKGEGAGS